jgi:type III pantothenate kinase
MNSLPLITVDIGNSSTKLAYFSSVLDNSRRVHKRSEMHQLPEPAWTCSINTVADLNGDLILQLPQQVRWRVASVHRERESQLAAWVQQHRPHEDYLALSYRDLPIEVRVDYPERVGMDRLAAAVGANVLREPHRGAVVVDAGSAVTVDLVSPDGAFEGGVILPGFRMSARALSGADQLPEVLLQTSNDPPAVLGKSTEAAIRSGLFWGTVGAVREIIERFAETHRRPHVFVTGGDLQRLAPLVSADAQFVPNLVLAGIAISVV